MPKGWRWDETLYQGSAPYYARGRPPYAPGLADALAEALALDGRGRLIDIGCGPGIVALALADRFAAVVGLDADRGMVREAARSATALGIANVGWVRARAETPPLTPGTFRVATFAQSFHWLDREHVAALVRQLLEPGGALVHISDVKDPPPARRSALPNPPPPTEAMRTLVRSYLGPDQRAGQGVLRFGSPDGEAAILHAAGFTGPKRHHIPGAGPLRRTIDDLVAWVYSLSSSAPHLFGDRLGAFEADLRHLLHESSPTGIFSEQPPDTEVFIWRRS